jgi:hypothetical protein
VSDCSTSNESDYKVFQRHGRHSLPINVRSLIPKLHGINIIARISRAAYICLSETWLDDSVPDYEIYIENYCVQRKYRNRHGFGVSFSIRKDSSFNNRSDRSHAEHEATLIELNIN